MEIEFTKEQFENLLKIVYLGNWMANAIHNGDKDDPIHKELEDIENYIFSFAKDFGFEKYVDDEDAKKGRFFPTNEFDEIVQEYVEDYDEECFWDEIFHRLSNRDFDRKYTDKEISKMEMKERFEKEEPFREKWGNELNNHGVERLEVKE